MSKRFLNIEYNNTQARIDTKDMEDISQVQKAVEEWYAKDFPEVTALKVQLWNKNTTEIKQIKTWSQMKGLSEAYFAEEDGLFITVQLFSPPFQAAHVDSPLIGQVLSVSINQSKLMKKYLTPFGSSPTIPNSPTHTDLSTLGLQLEQLMFCKNTTSRPCIVVDVQPRPLVQLPEELPTITIVLITGFDGKPLNEVMAEEELKWVIPIIPTATHPGTGTAISTIPEWMPHPNRKIPTYVLCIPIKVYAQNLRRFDEPLGLDPQNLEKLKLHILFLGEIVANADFVDLKEEWDDDEDDLEMNYEDLARIITWDEIAV